MPDRTLTDDERDIVLHGEPVQQQVTLSGRNGRTVRLSVNYETRSPQWNARCERQRAHPPPGAAFPHHPHVLGVSWHPAAARGADLTARRTNIAEISELRLDELRGFAAGLPAQLATELERLTTGLLAELDGRLTPLLDVGLGYLTLDRAGASLSTGERQRIELTSTVRASTTGMLYVLDEPSVGLHPANVTGLVKTITALAGNGNTVVIVEHERELIRAADWVIELGPRPAPTAAR